MTDRVWARFAETLSSELQRSQTGRAALRPHWRHLRNAARELKAYITDDEIRFLFGKEYSDLDPNENDLKALIAYAIGKGHPVRSGSLQAILERDRLAAPLAGLANLSGKALGETWAPRIAHYWLHEDGDTWEKMSARAYYDVAWTPHEPPAHKIRIELKCSSENPQFRFQQIRHPWKQTRNVQDYDVLLCLGITAASLDWWIIPSSDLSQLADTGANNSPVITLHHGKKEIIWNDQEGYSAEDLMITDERSIQVLAKYKVPREHLRSRLIALASSLGTL